MTVTLVAPGVQCYKGLSTRSYHNCPPLMLVDILGRVPQEVSYNLVSDPVLKLVSSQQGVGSE